MSQLKPARRRALPVLVLSALLSLLLVPAFGAVVMAGNDPASSGIVPLADAQPTMTPTALPDFEPASATPTVAPTETVAPSGGAGDETDQPTDPPTDSAAGAGLAAGALGGVLVLMAAALLVLLALPTIRARRR